ncbi:MAG: FKBP-type peptidyl-prolyl cis-trans isomerase [Bacteroidales bacterium]
MKTRLSFPLIFMVSMLIIPVSCNQLSKPRLNNNVDTASYAYGVYIGKSLLNQQMDMLDAELVKQGMEDVMKNNQDTMDIMAIQMILNDFFQEQQTRRVSEEYEENRIAGEEFLANNREEEGVITTESGLQYKILEEGTGASPDENDIVHVRYRGTLIDSTEFDASGEETVSFPVNSVIPGWTEVLQLMKEGSKWMVYIPQELAYGSSEMGGGVIPPFSTLIFEIELVEVEPQE